jgi:carbonic anhydrase
MTHYMSAVLASTLLACAAPPASPPHVAWSYSGATSPERWGDLDPSFAACSRGTRQSPIDLPLPPATPAKPAITSLHWDPVPLAILNNGHAVQVDDPAPSAVVIDGVTYSLVQFHFHVPSEHTLGGHAFDAELHLVHKTPDGKLAVIALLFQAGAENAVLHPLLDVAPMEAHAQRAVPGKTVDVGALVPRTPRFLSYDGSLTTPPCTEGVRWFVVLPDPAPLELSQGDLATLRSAMHAPNNRPRQATHDRAIDLRGL